MAEYAFDIYPANDPAGKVSTSLTAARLARLTIDGALVSGWYEHVGYGISSGEIRIHTDHASATEAIFAKRNYVMFVRTDGGDQQIGGFFLEEGDFAALSSHERGGRILTYFGPGGMAMLDRYVLGHSVYATGQTFRGDFNVPDQWTWNEEPYGAMLLRAVEEGQDHPDAFFAAITTDFTRTRDSNNNLWDELADYETPIGTSVLQMYADFLRLGLVAQMDAELSLTAYRDLEEFRTDRTSATFAAGKARFAAGVNIANELPKRVAPKQERTHVLIRDRIGDYQTVDVDLDGNPLGSEPYMAFLKSDTTADDAAILKMGKLHLTRRRNYADQAVVQHIIGSGTGQYEPGPAGDYWVLDLVTLHTGTAQHDFDEVPIEVASIRYFHDDAGNWFAETELGAQYMEPGIERFQAAISSTIRTIRALQLCQSGGVTEVAAGIEYIGGGSVASATLTGANIVAAITADTGKTAVDGDTIIVNPSTDASSTIPTIASGYTAIGAGGGGGGMSRRSAWKRLTAADIASGSWTFTTANTVDFMVYRGADPTAPIGTPVGAGDTATPDPDGQIAEITKTGGRAVAFLHTKSGTSLSGPVFLSGNNYDRRVTGRGGESGGWDDVGYPNNAVTILERIITFGTSSLWQSVVFELIPDPAPTANLPGDGRVELVGTSVKAKRCDDTEHWHEVGAGSPTVNDDVNDGFRVGTLWVNDDNQMWLLTDNTAGAADWLGPLGNTGADLSAINFLVGTASGLLSTEIVVGTTPGGQLGGTWAAPTLDFVSIAKWGD